MITWAYMRQANHALFCAGFKMKSYAEIRPGYTIDFRSDADHGKDLL